MTYPELVEYCGDERKAYYIAERLPYRDMTEHALTEKAIELMVRAKERASGPARLELIAGQRRDTLRGK
jgi:hypothetical protein